MQLLHVPHSTLHAVPRGQTSLALVFLVGGIIIFVGVSLAFLAASFVGSSLGFQSAQKALAVASAGANDAVLQLIRNKDFSDTSGYCVPAATPPCPDGSATVTVTQNSPLLGEATITSRATMLRQQRKVKAVVSVDPETAQVNILSWQELAF